MTTSQRQLYFRSWGACVKARGWNTADGRAADRAFFAAAPEIAQLHELVWALANGLAKQRGRDVAADDLRHGCHWVSLGADKSSKGFTNAELDRVLALFAVLTDPDDLQAVIALQDDQAGAIKRLVWSIQHLAPEPYTRAIASDKFGTRQWENLPVEKLRQLALTLRARRSKTAEAHA